MMLILQIAAGIILALFLLLILPIIIEAIKKLFEPEDIVYIAKHEGIKYVKFGEDGYILYSAETDPKPMFDQEKMKKILKWEKQ